MIFSKGDQIDTMASPVPSEASSMSTAHAEPIPLLATVIAPGCRRSKRRKRRDVQAEDAKEADAQQHPCTPPVDGPDAADDAPPSEHDARRRADRHNHTERRRVERMNTLFDALRAALGEDKDVAMVNKAMVLVEAEKRLRAQQAQIRAQQALLYDARCALAGGDAATARCLLECDASMLGDLAEDALSFLATGDAVADGGEHTGPFL